MGYIPLRTLKLHGLDDTYVAQTFPHNYLDNSDFRNPVNQRGQTSYIPAVDKTYRIDRWYTNEARTIELLSNGIEIGLSQNGMLGGLSQRLEHFAVGDIVTFAVQDSEGNRYVTTCALTDDVNAWADVGNGVFLRAICLGGDGIFTIGVSGSSKTFVWAALYEGEYTAETLPDYKPKGYGVELAECQRYYVQATSARISQAVMFDANGCMDTSVVLPTEMRINPTITIYPHNGGDLGAAGEVQLFVNGEYTRVGASIMNVSKLHFGVRYINSQYPRMPANMYYAYTASADL